MYLVHNTVSLSDCRNVHFMIWIGYDVATMWLPLQFGHFETLEVRLSVLFSQQNCRGCSCVLLAHGLRSCVWPLRCDPCVWTPAFGRQQMSTLGRWVALRSRDDFEVRRSSGTVFTVADRQVDQAFYEIKSRGFQQISTLYCVSNSLTISTKTVKTWHNKKINNVLKTLELTPIHLYSNLNLHRTIRVRKCPLKSPLKLLRLKLAHTVKQSKVTTKD